MRNNIYIIAEVAQGYEGKFNQSKLFIKAASKAKSSAVKFQLVYADELATKDYKYYNLFKDLEMLDEEWNNLRGYAVSFGLDFIVDIFGVKSLKTAEKIGLQTVKVHGTDITNILLLRAIANSSIEKVILGIGGAYWDEIETAIKILSSKTLTLLCGFQGYPTRIEDNQILRMKLIQNKVNAIHSNFKMGFADHPKDDSFSSIISLVAVGAGATTIEKHITLGRVMELEDFESALNPDEFASFVNDIIFGQKALGNLDDENDFKMSSSEKKYRKNIRRDVVAMEDIEAGEILTLENITLKRTSSDEAIKNLDLVLGKSVNKKIKRNQLITINHFGKRK